MTSTSSTTVLNLCNPNSRLLLQPTPRFTVNRNPPMLQKTQGMSDPEFRKVTLGDSKDQAELPPISYDRDSSATEDLSGDDFLERPGASICEDVIEAPSGPRREPHGRDFRDEHAPSRQLDSGRSDVRGRPYGDRESGGVNQQRHAEQRPYAGGRTEWGSNPAIASRAGPGPRDYPSRRSPPPIQRAVAPAYPARPQEAFRERPRSPPAAMSAARFGERRPVDYRPQGAQRPAAGPIISAPESRFDQKRAHYQAMGGEFPMNKRHRSAPRQPMEQPLFDRQQPQPQQYVAPRRRSPPRM